jgi:hypothetical protein
MSRVPPNCRFEIDDFEQPWSYSKPFDYIHGRELEGSIRDHDLLFRQALDNLNPNGWLEMASFDVNTYSDDGTHLKATNLMISIKHMHESSRMFGKDMTSSPSWKERMVKVGFVNVKEDVYKVCSAILGKDGAPCLLVNSCPKVHGPKTPSSRSLVGTISLICLKLCLFTHTRCFQECLGGHVPRLKGCWQEFEWSCGIRHITCTRTCGWFTVRNREDLWLPNLYELENLCPRRSMDLNLQLSVSRSFS